jgi:hypothetical protein
MPTPLRYSQPSKDEARRIAAVAKLLRKQDYYFSTISYGSSTFNSRASFSRSGG